MKVLPIRFLNDEDKFFFGEDLVNLAYLQRLGIPVAQGFAILPPSTLLSEFKKNPTKPALLKIKEEFKKNPYQEELFTRIKEKKITKKIWEDLIDKWFAILEQELEKDENVTLKDINLKPQPVYLTDQIKAWGEAYVDKNRQLVEVKINEGLLSPDQYSQLEDIIKQANSKLLLDFLFDWILEKDQFKILKLKPLTQNFEPEYSKDLKVLGGKSLSEDLPTVFKINRLQTFDSRGWTEIDTPEALLKMDSLEGGIGFLVDLDKIYKLVTGSDDLTLVDAALLKSFFEEPVKKALNIGCPVLFKGQTASQDNVLRFLIKLGVQGVVLGEVPPGFSDYIRQLEHLHINSLLD